MKLSDTIKGLIQSNGWNYVRLADEMNKHGAKTYDNKKLSQKIKNETIHYKEMLLIYQILGYSIKKKKMVMIQLEALNAIKSCLGRL